MLEGHSHKCLRMHLLLCQTERTLGCCFVQVQLRCKIVTRGGPHKHARSVQQVRAGAGMHCDQTIHTQAHTQPDAAAVCRCSHAPAASAVALQLQGNRPCQHHPGVTARQAAPTAACAAARGPGPAGIRPGAAPAAPSSSQGCSPAQQQQRRRRWHHGWARLATAVTQAQALHTLRRAAAGCVRASCAAMLRCMRCLLLRLERCVLLSLLPAVCAHLEQLHDIPLQV